MPSHLVLRRSLVVLLVFTAVTAGLQFSQPQPADARAPRCAATKGTQARAERQFARRIKAARKAADRYGLPRHQRLNVVARRWSRQMSRRNDLAHNPRYTQQMGALSWRRAGENVGYRRDRDARCWMLVRSLHRALMRSPGHRANILGSYNRVGVGVKIDRDGTMWVTQNFALIRR